ncbi:MAG: ATP-dependent Clp protease ATP-binding subunit [Bacillota bacterium]|nr:ATP-dependent Clp protease ATP-binding subunit [Bacillota bacterium]
MPVCDRCGAARPLEVRPLARWVPLRVLRQFGAQNYADAEVGLCGPCARELRNLLSSWQQYNEFGGESLFDMLFATLHMALEPTPLLYQLRSFLAAVIRSLEERRRGEAGEGRQTGGARGRGEAGSGGDEPGEGGGEGGAAGPFEGAFPFGQGFMFFAGPGGQAAVPLGQRTARAPSGIDDLVELARQGKLEPVVGRQREMRQLEDVLTRRTKNNAVLIGEAGVGKTAIVEGLAQRIASGQVSAALRARKILRLDLGTMLAGTKYRGEFEERFKRAMNAAQKERAIVFIDELHTILGAGAAEGAMDAANMLKPLLARGELQVIGATTADEYHRTIENDAALDRRFSPIWVPEPGLDEAVEMLKALREREIAYYGSLPTPVHLEIPDETLEAAVRMAAQYVPERHLPDKAVDLLQDAIAHHVVETTSGEAGGQGGKAPQEEIAELQRQIDQAVREQAFERAAELKRRRDALRQESGQSLRITPEDIAEAVSRRTGIPVGRLSSDEAERLARLEERLGQRVYGQPEAVSALSRAVRAARSGLGKEKGAYAFFFLGPTGVGKTEMAKALAEALFGTEEALIAFDMSEYQEPHTISRLLGSPPGYVGYGEEGRLVKALKEHPYSVLLFDEAEKAHPDIFNAFLQMMAEGRITGANGHTADASHAFLIFTSNVGSEELAREAIGFRGDRAQVELDRQERAMRALRRAFRPEFLGRLDAVVVFHDLGPEQYRRVAEKFVRRLGERLAERYPGLRLEVTPEAVERLVELGTAPETGARQMGRVVEREITDQLVDVEKWLAEGSLQAPATLTVDVPRGAESAPEGVHVVIRGPRGLLGRSQVHV